MVRAISNALAWRYIPVLKGPVSAETPWKWGEYGRAWGRQPQVLGISRRSPGGSRRCGRAAAFMKYKRSYVLVDV